MDVESQPRTPCWRLTRVWCGLLLLGAFAATAGTGPVPAVVKPGATVVRAPTPATAPEPASAPAPTAATLWVVIAIDTENGRVDWYASGKPRQNDPNPLFDTSNFKPSDRETSAIFSPAFRQAHRDMAGTPFKMSWFAEMDALMAAATYLDESPQHPELTGKPCGYTAVLDTLQRYWRVPLEQFDDGLYWHYHVQVWSGSRWLGCAEAAALPDHAQYGTALTRMLLDAGFYPSVFRAGWLWENDALGRFLNNWVPYDFTPSAGTWRPWHPQLAPEGRPDAPAVPQERWLARSNGGPVMQDVRAAFTEARQKGTAVYCLNFHDRENMTASVEQLHKTLVATAAAFPGVTFRYGNALEALQAVLGMKDHTPPRLRLVRLDDQRVRVESNEALWRDMPYLAARYANADSKTAIHLTPEDAGTNAWEALCPPVLASSDEDADVERLERLAVGACDLAGNAATAVMDLPVAAPKAVP